MKKTILLLAAVLMAASTLSAQSAGNDEDGKKIDKEKLETKDYLPKVNGTIRAKYEYQTGMGAGRFEVRNARVSLTGNILPISCPSWPTRRKSTSRTKARSRCSTPTPASSPPRG